MPWDQLPLGPLQTNCYMIYDDEHCLIFDPGGDADVIFEWIKHKEVKPLAILLTHAHFDHIGAVDELRMRYSIPVYLHEDEKDWLGNPSLNGSQFFVGHTISTSPADVYIREEKTIDIGPFSMKVFFTPGHSPGSVSYYFHELNSIVSGDVLFQGSIGRTDLPGGNINTLMESIHQKLLSIPENTTVLPGHGPTTTIQAEMDGNPFLNGFSF